MNAPNITTYANETNHSNGTLQFAGHFSRSLWTEKVIKFFGIIVWQFTWFLLGLLSFDLQFTLKWVWVSIEMRYNQMLSSCLRNKHKRIQRNGCLNLFNSVYIKRPNGEYEKLELQSSGDGAKIPPNGNRNDIALMWARSCYCLGTISFGGANNILFVNWL